ncbi:MULTISPECIES: hypothetical protein [Cyanophyceae]|uniref:hypothetical protein n=1 Tax=Cyanophyceae TaxID=3028117 RepID=UPI0016886B3F|nr:hypothetical protein [Trichocoleus sp. FACHB-40]MBD2006350.1 hypothetical protein [Trichocoleus sp. FACHB-40]
MGVGIAKFILAFVIALGAIASTPPKSNDFTKPKANDFSGLLWFASISLVVWGSVDILLPPKASQRPMPEEPTPTPVAPIQPYPSDRPSLYDTIRDEMLNSQTPISNPQSPTPNPQVQTSSIQRQVPLPQAPNITPQAANITPELPSSRPPLQSEENLFGSPRSVYGIAPSGTGKSTHLRYELGKLFRNVPGALVEILETKGDDWNGLEEIPGVVTTVGMSNVQEAIKFLERAMRMVEERQSLPESTIEKLRVEQPAWFVIDDHFGVRKLISTYDAKLLKKFDDLIQYVVTVGRSLGVKLAVFTQSPNLKALGIDDAEVRKSIILYFYGREKAKGQEQGDSYFREDESSGFAAITNVLFRNAAIIDDPEVRDRLKSQLPAIKEYCLSSGQGVLMKASGMGGYSLLPEYSQMLAGAEIPAEVLQKSSQQPLPQSEIPAPVAELPLEALLKAELEMRQARTNLECQMPPHLDAILSVAQARKRSIKARDVQMANKKATESLTPQDIRLCFTTLENWGYGKCDGEGDRISFCLNEFLED